MKKLTDLQFRELSIASGIEYAMLRAFDEVESGGKGFDDATGKLIIQFEPSWFRKKAPYAPSGKWSVNGIERQSKEWIAFNDAFAKNPNAAMESTSIGRPQIMGFHYKLLGYKTVGEMWDDFKESEYKQLAALVRFIKANPKLYKAMINHDFHTIASIYNGSGYAKLAKKLGREPYNISLRKSYNKWKAKEI